MDIPRHGARPARRRAVGAVGAVVTLFLVLVCGMPVAQAHDGLTSASPADGSAVTAAPASVELGFSGAVQALGAQVVVTGPDGTAVTDGAVEVDGTTVRRPLVAGLPAGAYTVDWRVTSADGHPVAGTTTFTVTGGAGGAAPVSEAAADRPAGSGPPPLALGIGAGVVLVAAATVAVRRLRGSA
ncbi:copper resistance CopC family protein [Blastococcus sp. SYSU D00820]